MKPPTETTATAPDAPKIATRDDAQGLAPTYNAYTAQRARLTGSAAKAEELFAHYPEEIRQDAVWLWHYVRAKCNDQHAMLGAIARSLGLKDRSGKDPSDQYWYQVVRGHYFKSGGDAGVFRRYVSAFRAHARAREESGAIPFVETRNWALVRDYIETRRRADAVCRFGGIEGETGAGKTAALKHYTVINNHCETVYLEAPARATRTRFIQKLSACYMVAMSAGIVQRELEIERFLSGTGTDGRARAVVVDNVQRLFRPNTPPDQQPIFNYLHELQDDTGCCVILTWVPSFRRVITARDPFWAQFLGRIGGEDEILRLDQRPPRRDLAAIAREFAVADDARAWDHLKKWSGTQWGLRVLFHKLNTARLLATRRREKQITVAHLQAVDMEPLPAADEEGGEA
ncbi:MAG: ATP-binding protein [Opitutaceae bacterium]|jgi:hypothetical protein|nr:ATP-binding protein [Opitutaceae bacterium]